MLHQQSVTISVKRLSCHLSMAVSNMSNVTWAVCCYFWKFPMFGAILSVICNERKTTMQFQRPPFVLLWTNSAMEKAPICRRSRDLFQSFSELLSELSSEIPSEFIFIKLTTRAKSQMCICSRLGKSKILCSLRWL